MGSCGSLSRRDQLSCKYESALIAANDIRLCVLAPAPFYGAATARRELHEMLNAGLSHLGAQHGVRMCFAFQAFPESYSGREVLCDSELIQLFEERADLV